MMEKAIKQRLLGGVVLVAGAALFLPVLLDGSGSALTIPPLPKAPEVSSVEAMAPQLDQKVAETEQAVDAAHAGRDEAGAEAAPAAGEVGGDVAPDAAALAAGETAPAAAAAAAATSAKSAATPAAAASLPPKAPAPVAATAAPKAVAASTPAAPAAKPGVVATTATAAPAGKPQPAPVAAAPAPVPARETAKALAPEAPVAKAAADKSLPGAWLVQVGVFSSREKAQGLVQQLRRKGYAAVLSPQGSNFKVVVGPELNRSVADSIKARLAADPELKLSGWVQAYKP